MINHHWKGIKDFFDPNMLLEKEDWTWNERDKTLNNPQTRTIEGIDKADMDYDFKEHVLMNVPESFQDMPLPLSGFSQAADLTATHLDRVLAGVEVDSVSTLGNPHTPGRKYTPQSISTTTGNSSSPSQSLSGHSYASIDSRVSNIETQINSLEAKLTNTIKSSMESVLQHLKSAGDSTSGSEP